MPMNDILSSLMLRYNLISEGELFCSSHLLTNIKDREQQYKCKDIISSEINSAIKKYSQTLKELAQSMGVSTTALA
jgi:hypothetical protein